MDISKRIIEVREEKRKTQADLARLLGMEQSNYARLEKRGKKLTFEQIEKIALALGVTAKELLFGEEDNTFYDVEIEGYDYREALMLPLLSFYYEYMTNYAWKTLLAKQKEKYMEKKNGKYVLTASFDIIKADLKDEILSSSTIKKLSDVELLDPMILDKIIEDYTGKIQLLLDLENATL
jgi:transcriptional regulator with XRE-family HTH domain